MQIDKHKIVSIDYTLTDDQGEVIDSSEGSEPLAYLHGVGGIIPGLERALEGKSAGDQLKVSLAPEDGYGQRNEDLCQGVPRSEFAEVEDLAEGMEFRVDSEAGPMVITVVEIGDETVQVDGNHALAGMTLHFEVTICDVREATAEEIEHGHAHGEGGHAH